MMTARNSGRGVGEGSGVFVALDGGDDFSRFEFLKVLVQDSWESRQRLRPEGYLMVAQVYAEWAGLFGFSKCQMFPGLRVPLEHKRLERMSDEDVASVSNRFFEYFEVFGRSPFNESELESFAGLPAFYGPMIRWMDGCNPSRSMSGERILLTGPSGTSSCLEFKGEDYLRIEKADEALDLSAPCDFADLDRLERFLFPPSSRVFWAEGKRFEWFDRSGLSRIIPENI